MEYKHLFGPVNSRRLGVSLGVDLVPAKTCTLNCIYCEAGKTTAFTSTRQEYVKYEEIILELDDYLENKPHLDFITFSGAGEPTLFSRLGELINHIRTHYPGYRICLITNSTLLSNPQVVTEILDVDVILPSLDAVSESVFQKMNRPCPGITSAQIIEGLVALRKQFSHQMWLEIFIVPGINDSEEEIKLFREVVLQIQPDQVQLNSLDRPGTENWVQPENRASLEDIARKLQPTEQELQNMHYRTEVTIIAKSHANHVSEMHSGDLREKILALLARRPSTLQDIAGLLSSDVIQINLILNELVETAVITSEELPRGTFYKLKTGLDE